MSVRITHIRLSSTYYTDHEHITDFYWVSYEDGSTGYNNKVTMVDWIGKGGLGYVESGNSKVPVLVVRPHQGEPYLRAYANNLGTDNLLSLPRF